MLEYILNFFYSYTSADFSNWVVGIGTLTIGVGTVMMARAAKTIPDKIVAYYKDKKTIFLYQRVFYRMFMKTFATKPAMDKELPKDLLKLVELFRKEYPDVLGQEEDVIHLMNDLMKDNYFKRIRGNVTIEEIIKW